MKNIVLFKKIPTENKIAYLFSVGMGVGVSILITIIPSFFLSYEAGFHNELFTFAVITPITIATIIFLLILLKWFPVVKKDIKTRLKCIALMLISYMYIECYRTHSV